MRFIYAINESGHGERQVTQRPAIPLHIQKFFSAFIRFCLPELKLKHEALPTINHPELSGQMNKFWQFPLVLLSCLALCQCASFPGNDESSGGVGDLESDPDAVGMDDSLGQGGDYGVPPTAVQVVAKLDAALMVIELDGERRTILIKLNEVAAPKTVLNFKRNVTRGYYDGLAFHRVIPHYVIQTGDPLTRDDLGRGNWGTGGPGYTLEPGLKHVKGSVAMARLGDAMNPDRESSGSQFYLCLRDLPQLDGNYTVFGVVLQGLDVLNDLSRVTTDAEDMPTERIEVRTMKLISSKSRLATPKKKSPKSKPDSEKGRFEKMIERIW